MGVLVQIDQGLQKYYGHKKSDYTTEDADGQSLGKFAQWADENGYDTDMVEEELLKSGGDLNDISCLDFDEDFPSSLEGDARLAEIYKVMMECFKNPSAFAASADIPVRKPRVQQSTTSHYASQHATEATYASKPVYVNEDERWPEYNPADFENAAPHSQSTPGAHKGTKHSPSKPATRAPASSSTSKAASGPIASDAVYESELFVIKLKAEAIEDASLRVEFESAMALKRAADRAMGAGQLKAALKHYSGIFVHLGCQGARRLSAFCNAACVAQDSPVDVAMDTLRVYAYLHLIEVHEELGQWHKVIAKSTCVCALCLANT